MLEDVRHLFFGIFDQVINASPLADFSIASRHCSGENGQGRK